MLSALILDLDGTLLDTNDAHVEGWVRAFARLGYKIRPDRIAQEVGKGGDNLVPAILGESADHDDGDAIRDAAKEEFLAIARTRRFRAFDGALELLDALRARGMQLALATSSSEEQLAAMFASAGVGALEHGPLRDRLDVLVTKSDVARSKPYPDVVLAALEKLHRSAAECAMVGDTPFDALSARRAGVVTLGLLSGRMHAAQQLRAAGARRVWRDPAHLLAEVDEALCVASPGRIVLGRDVQERLMRDALAVAEEAMARGGLPVGCVVADGDGRVIARGHHAVKDRANRIAHAEIVALGALDGRVSPDARDLVLATTLEPCVMCTGAAMEAAVDTILFALRAPPDAGTARVRPPESPATQVPRVVGDVLAAESRALLTRWHEAHARDDGDPWVAYVRQVLGGGARGEG